MKLSDCCTQTDLVEGNDECTLEPLCVCAFAILNLVLELIWTNEQF